jgi:hypothetical protein
MIYFKKKNHLENYTRTLKKKAGTKNENWNFRETKIQRKILEGLKMKFIIFKGTKNIYLTLY